MSTYTTPVTCADCGQEMTFLQWEQHTHPQPAPDLLAALRAAVLTVACDKCDAEPGVICHPDCANAPWCGPTQEGTPS